MENRQDYLGLQEDTLTKVLKKLLQKLLKVKSVDSNSSEIQDIVTSDIAIKESLSIEALSGIDNAKLITLLTEQYHYSNENLKLLGDLFYELYQLNNHPEFAKKAHILYSYTILNAGRNLDISVFVKKQKLDGLI